MPENPKKPTIKERLFGASKALQQKDAALAASAAEVERLNGLLAAATEAAATEPAATEPAATEPAATEPAATEPAATEPAATEAAATEAAPAELVSLESFKALEARLAATESAHTAALAEIERLESEAKSAEIRAIEILAEAGHDASDLVPATTAESSSTDGLAGRDRFLAATEAAQPEIFRKN
jgi:hypothetical protein